MSTIPLPVDARPWTGDRDPRAILAIRMQCLGDLAVTMPYLRQVRERFPSARLSLVTRTEYADFARAHTWFDDVWLVPGGNRGIRRAVASVPLWPILLRPSLRDWPPVRRYDVVLDLQNDRTSRLLRSVAAPRAYVGLDVHSPRSAGERVRSTLSAAGLGEFDHRFTTGPVREGRGEQALIDAGWRRDAQLVCLNPASDSPSRQWPDARFVEFAHRWLATADGPVQFVVDGLPRMAARAARIVAGIGRTHALNLVGTTGKGDLYGVLRHVALVVSEDSGLMHVAWTSGVPTIALFGGSTPIWAQPLGPHSAFFDARAFPCAPCLAEHCRFGDTRCMDAHPIDAIVATGRRLARRV